MYLMQPVRTRIAPSPTGEPHVGTAYVSLFNYCFAKQQGGEFILRIEDTDQQRSTASSEAKILQSLHWLGIHWDEGPDQNGKYGPYRQSERRDIYQQHAQQLIEQGHAFYCFRSPEELEKLRQQRREQGLNPGFKLENPELPELEVKKRLSEGHPYVIRMKVPEHGVCQFTDLLRGTVEIDWAQVDMQVLLKADGMPTYHLANVVDDHLMRITHVIRGEEWINSTPKHQLLYEYFGWELPVFCHLPLLRNPDKSKLSKRKNPTSILFYQRMGYLPEALLNYLGRMGWSFPDEREKFSLEEMVRHFNINRISLGGPIFDIEKLKWLNSVYIREDLSLTDFTAWLQEWAFNEPYLTQIAQLIQNRIEVLSDVTNQAAFFFTGLPELAPNNFEHKKLKIEDTGKILQFSLWALESIETWSKQNISVILTNLAKVLELKMKELMFPIFIAISGNAVAPPIMDSMVILGPEMSRARLQHALTILKIPSKKQTKKWQNEFEYLKQLLTKSIPITISNHTK